MNEFTRVYRIFEILESTEMRRMRKESNGKPEIDQRILWQS